MMGRGGYFFQIGNMSISYFCCFCGVIIDVLQGGSDKSPA